MKGWFWRGAVAATIAVPGMSGAAWAGGTDDFGCSNATLKGAYAFGVTNYTPPPQVVAGIRFTTARAISPSVITSATASQPSSHRRGRKRAPTRSIPTAQGATCST